MDKFYKILNIVDYYYQENSSYGNLFRDIDFNDINKEYNINKLDLRCICFFHYLSNKYGYEAYIDFSIENFELWNIEFWNKSDFNNSVALTGLSFEYINENNGLIFYKDDKFVLVNSKEGRVASILSEYFKKGYPIHKLITDNQEFINKIYSLNTNISPCNRDKLQEIAKKYNLQYELNHIYDKEKIIENFKIWYNNNIHPLDAIKSKQFLKECGYEYISQNFILEVLRDSHSYDLKKIQKIRNEYKRKGLDFSVLKLYKDINFLKETGYLYIPITIIKKTITEESNDTNGKQDNITTTTEKQTVNVIASAVSKLNFSISQEVFKKNRDINTEDVINFYNVINLKNITEISFKNIQEVCSELKFDFVMFGKLLQKLSNEGFIKVEHKEDYVFGIEVIKEYEEKKENVIDNFLNIFFNNLEEPQKIIIQKLLEDKLIMQEKLNNVYEEFQDKFDKLKQLTIQQIELTKKIEGGM